MKHKKVACFTKAWPSRGPDLHGHTKPKHTRIDVERRDVRLDDYGKIWENVVGTSAPSPSLRSAILIPHVRWVNGPEIQG